MPKKIAPTIRLVTLGEPLIITPIATLGPTAEVAFSLALYLILEKNGKLRRRQLQEVFWPSASSSTRAHRLRQNLLKLRHLGIAVESVAADQIGIHRSQVILDYEVLLASEDSQQTNSSDSISVLAGYAPRFSAPFAEWVDSKRSEIQSRLYLSLMTIIAGCRARGEWLQVERHASRLLSFRPDDEEVTLVLAEALAIRGAKTEAIEVLRRLLRSHRIASHSRRAAEQMHQRVADGVDPRGDRLPETPFVGRASTIQTLLLELGHARSQCGRTVVLSGEPGVGKSRVLSEFATICSLRGVTSARVDCRPGNRSRPLAVFQELVPQLLQLPGALGCSPQTMESLQRLTGATPSEVSLTEESHDIIFGRIRSSIYDLLDALLDEQLLVVFVEDVHWIDDKSFSLLSEIIHWSQDRRILFFFTTREHPERWTGTARSVIPLPLHALSDTDATAIVKGVVRRFGREMSTDYVDWCVRIAEGNPYFLQELANQWLESGEQQELPPSLAAVLGQRINRLPDTTLLVLQTCALLESNSTAERLDKVLELPSHVLLQGINDLGKAGMLLHESKSGNPDKTVLLRCRHILLSNAAVARLSPPALAFLHRRVGIVLESELESESSSSLLFDCAKHWGQSGDKSRALRLANSCATRLMRVGLPGDAAEAYRRALEFCVSDKERLAILEGEARARYAANEWDRVKQLVTEIHRLKRCQEPRVSLHDDYELMYLRAEWRTFRWETLLERAIKCVTCSAATPSHRVEAGYSALMLMVATCDHERMRETFNLLQTIATQGNVPKQRWLELSMVFHTTCGDMPTAVSAVRQLLDLCKESGNVGETFRTLCNSAVTFRTAGLFEDARSVLLEAVDLANSHRIQLALVRVYPILANLALELGRTDDAERWLRELRKQPVDRADRFTRLETSAIAIRVALARGQYREAARLAPAHAVGVAEDPLVQRRTYSVALLVVTELAVSGKVDEDLLELLVRSHLVSRVNPHQAFEAYSTYVGLLAVGQRDRAESLLLEYLQQYRREPWDPPTHLLDTLLGLLSNLPIAEKALATFGVHSQR